MTTAKTQDVFKEDGVTPADSFDMGSGRIDLAAAATAILTFDVPGTDYVNHASDLWTVNYPSIYIPAMPDKIVLTRTAHNNCTADSTWTINLTAPTDLIVKVATSIIVPGRGNKKFTITIIAKDVPPGETRHATIQMTSGQRSIALPITIVRP